MNTPRPYRATPMITGALAVHAGAVAALAVSPETWPWAAAGVVASHAALTAAGLWPRSTLLGHNWLTLPESAVRSIAITIDDGPDPEITPRMLDLLDRHAARATFFCIGELVRKHPKIVEQIIARGHAVENHSQRHRHHFSLLGPGALRREIEAAQNTIGEIAGVTPRFFRAPAGLRNPFLEPVLCALGLQLASWTRRGFDTRERSAKVVADRLTRGLAARDILLLHDGHPARDATGEPVSLEALDIVLRKIADEGLRCVTLREVIT